MSTLIAWIIRAIPFGTIIMFGSMGETITEKSGNLVGVKSVSKDDEIMLITTEGIIIRMQVNDTTLLGRVTTGVKLINLGDGIKVASIAKVVEDKSLIPQEEDNTEE